MDEPAYKWWVPYTFCKTNVIISSVKTRMKHKDMKYGVRVSKNYKAKQLDKDNGNNLRYKTYEKEMTNVGIAFQVLHDSCQPPPG